MGHKILYLSSLLVTCPQSSRLYGVYNYGKKYKNPLKSIEIDLNIPLDLKKMSRPQNIRVGNKIFFGPV